MNYPLPFDCGVQRYALLPILQIFDNLYSGNPHKYLQINRIVFRLITASGNINAFGVVKTNKAAVRLAKTKSGCCQRVKPQVIVLYGTRSDTG